MRTQTRVYKIQLNEEQKQLFIELCGYRRWAWNHALDIWNEMYEVRRLMADYTEKVKIVKEAAKTHDEVCRVIREIDRNSPGAKANPSPSWQRVRNELNSDKETDAWRLAYPAHLANLAVQDLGNAWKNFFDKAQPNWGKPKYKSRKAPRQGFKSDQSKIEGQILKLECPQGRKDWPLGRIRLNEPVLSDDFGVISYFTEAGNYYASIPFQVEDIKQPAKTGKATAVDVNVGHFDYTEGRVNVLPKRLDKIYKKIKHYQRQLARKRIQNRKAAYNSKNYLKTRAKLQACYRKAGNIQNDLIQKFTTELVRDYDKIVIENLSVKGMLMSHVASKGVHRSMFSKFKQILTYKCDWYGKELILANKLYPSTQRCAACGNVKKGDEKITLYGNKNHGTKHNEYVCYNKKCPNYNKVVDRDKNAMLSLLALAEHPELNKAL